MSEKISLQIGILTVSDTRNLDNDFSGLKIQELAQEKELQVVNRLVVKDDIQQIRTGFETLAGLDVVICNGGTGIAKRDVTFESLQPLMQQELPGFGELFRALSFQEIGSHALASRATCFFTAQDQLVFVLPGSTSACELAMQRLILPEIYHLIKEKRK